MKVFIFSPHIYPYHVFIVSIFILMLIISEGYKHITGHKIYKLVKWDPLILLGKKYIYYIHKKKNICIYAPTYKYMF